jgi:hypothetical protein
VEERGGGCGGAEADGAGGGGSGSTSGGAAGAVSSRRSFFKKRKRKKDLRDDTAPLLRERGITNSRKSVCSGLLEWMEGLGEWRHLVGRGFRV